MAARSRILALLLAVLWVLGWGPAVGGDVTGEHASQHDWVDTPCRRGVDPVGPDPDPDDVSDDFGSRADLDPDFSLAWGLRSARAAPDPARALNHATSPRGPPSSPPINLRG